MITGHCQLNKHLFIISITDSPLCRACMEADETPTHVLLRCTGVAEQCAAYLGAPASLPEALGDLGGLIRFWSELGWLESPSGELYQWHYVQRKVPAGQVRRQAQRKKKKKTGSVDGYFGINTSAL
ncbi:jg14953 [Pararge aegeria aegeria]|uniref:Jg14953 protein n=1 Tax=Pararge aegeria aegeria TaxID=348720 RepID=A0A8S4SDL1_9NEOP|nr:jg14953 [Pararge aegeria aegeria]